MSPDPSFLADCEAAVLRGDQANAVELAGRALADGTDLVAAIENGFSKGVRAAGLLWERGEYFLPELAFSAEVMRRVMDVLLPSLRDPHGSVSKGVVVIGTVNGDIHDIGKSLVATLLSANGYAVTDLGADVPDDRFVASVRDTGARILCLSALLTTTMPAQRSVIAALAGAGLRESCSVVVGGAPTNARWARDIGADAHAGDAVDAVRVLNGLL